MILDELAQAARERVAREKEAVSPEEMKKMAEARKLSGFPFEKALSREGISFICEIKRASPSKGVIAASIDPAELAREYEKAGASAISVLTEPQWFLGNDRDLETVHSVTSLPILRKDFTVDPYMIYQARVLGASAVLLIVSLLDEDTLREWIGIAHDLGMSALVEAHDAAEIDTAIAAGARIIGVNNRNLRDFTVDMSNASTLSERIPDSVLFVSESGIRDAGDVLGCMQAGADAVLVGESLMRAEDRVARMKELRSALPSPFRIKLCGLFRSEDIEAANRIHPDMVGFILADKGHRKITHEQARKLRSLLDPDIRAVGVFIDEDIRTMVSLAREKVIDAIQLHGSETNSVIEELKEALPDVPVIKAFAIRNADDLHQAEASAADLVLFDFEDSGSGQSFDWSLLEGFSKPFALAGGIRQENIERALSLHPVLVDVSSGIETDRVKDPEKMQKLVETIRRYPS